MGRRGPQPKPDELKRREGKKVPPRGWRAPPGAPVEPDWTLFWPGGNADLEVRAQNTRMRAAARAQWRLVVDGLRTIGLLAQLDEALMVTHCTQFALYREGIRSAARDGLVVTGGKGQLQMNPALRVSRDAAAQMAKTMPVLGLTPTARNFLAPPNPNEEPEPTYESGVRPDNVVGLWD